MKKIMIFSLIIIGTIFISGFVALYIVSPGNPKQFYDKDRNILSKSISEKIFLQINNSDQGLVIKSKNIDNPVILYLHGGMPDYFFTEKYPTYLENYFTIVWWEQRNCGISCQLKSNNKPVQFNQLIDDTIELTKYLQKRFGKDKIYLMGHSGGTFLGLFVIEKAPELYHAYIGIAQMSDQFNSEVLACDYIKAVYKKNNNKEMFNFFEKIKLERHKKIPEEYLRKRDEIMHKLGIGTMRNTTNIVRDIFIPSLLFSEYTILEKFKLWYSKSKSGISQNWKLMQNTNLIDSKTTFKIPIYFFQGKYDHTCSYVLAKKYFNKLKAPVKGFYTFHNSAHSPLFEEPKKFIQIMTEDVKNIKTELSDKLSE